MADTAKAPWPGERNEDGPWGAEAVMRWVVSDGLAAAAVSVDLVRFEDADNPKAARLRYMANTLTMFHGHDLHLALSALRELDPAKADEIADRIVLAAVCGDSYGEWLWQWAKEDGLDADAICAEARSALAAEAGEEAP